MSLLNDKCKNPDESFLELLIIPPCDSAGIIESWAQESGHQVLEPPSRDVLSSQLAPELPQLDGHGLLVIPRLEYWFIRHHRGLRHVSSLLKMIRQCDRPVLVSCNSWCWRYLAHVVDTDLVLPEPIAFEAFNARRLRDWLNELSSSDGTDKVRFLDVNDGHDIMAGDDVSVRFEELADLSLGIPWVAWQLWRRSLRTADEREAEEAVDSEESGKPKATEKKQTNSDIKTLWVTNNPSPLIPLGHEPESLRLLHALLIHDSLSVEELADVLPNIGESQITSALIRAGFIEVFDDQLRVRASAYPAVRSGLSAAGIPTGAI